MNRMKLAYARHKATGEEGGAEEDEQNVSERKAKNTKDGKQTKLNFKKGDGEKDAKRRKN